MIYINLIKKEQEAKKQEQASSGISGLYRILNSNLGRYVAASVAGAGLLITSASREGLGPASHSSSMHLVVEASYTNKIQSKESRESREIKGSSENKESQDNKEIRKKDEKDNNLSLDDYIIQSNENNQSNENRVNESQQYERQPNEKPVILDHIEAKKGDYVLVVNKETQRAQLYKMDFVQVDTTSVSTGRNPGDKQRLGDNKTPRGTFEVVSVEDSANWLYNGKHAYGPHFARLSAGSWDSSGNYDSAGLSDIGVHGTDEPEKLGKPASHGCVRMASEIIDEYVINGYIKKGSKVAIVDNTNDVALAPSRTLSTYLANNNVSNNVSSSNNSDNNAKQFSVDTNYLRELGKKGLEEKNLEQIITKPIKSPNKVIDNSGLEYSSASAKKDYEPDQKEKILKDAQKVVDSLNQMIPNQNFVYKQTEAKAKSKLPNTTKNKTENNGESKSKGNEAK